MTSHPPDTPADAGLPVTVAADAEAMSRLAADRVVTALGEDPDLLLGAATGRTPTRTYELLADRAASEPQLFSRLRLLKLDEWGGLASDDPATCEAYLRRHLIAPLAIDPDRYLGWESRPADAGRECRRVAAWLAREGPVGLCLLGLGANGHLAFIEPADALVPGPHLAQLSDVSLAHPMLRQSRGKAGYGLTVGIGDVLRSRRILLLVSGSSKAAPLRRLVEGGITTRFPASFLKLHAHTTVLCDREAASLLEQD